VGKTIDADGAIADEAITLGFNYGDLDAGHSVTWSFVTSIVQHDEDGNPIGTAGRDYLVGALGNPNVWIRLRALELLRDTRPEPKAFEHLLLAPQDWIRLRSAELALDILRFALTEVVDLDFLDPDARLPAGRRSGSLKV